MRVANIFTLGRHGGGGQLLPGRRQPGGAAPVADGDARAAGADVRDRAAADGGARPGPRLLGLLEHFDQPPALLAGQHFPCVFMFSEVRHTAPASSASERVVRRTLWYRSPGPAGTSSPLVQRRLDSDRDSPTH